MKTARDIVSPNTEIELKLLCDPQYLAKVADAPIVARYACDQGETIDLSAVYYDTADLALSKAGCALRVRTDGGRFVMTFKAKRREAGKALERGEWKWPVRNLEPDLAALSPFLPQFLPVAAVAKIEREALQPMVRTVVRRTTRMLATPLGRIELAIDRGRIVAGDRSVPVSEVELELMDGSIEALFLLAHELVLHFPLRPSVRSKSARGFDLASGVGPGVSRAPDVMLADDATLEQMFDAVLRAASQHLLGNQAAAEDGHDPDAIHQYRVALRRLRSMLKLMLPVAPSSRAESFQHDVKWLMSNIGVARDWDVFVTQTLPRISRSCSPVEGFEALAGAAEDHRRRAHVAMKKAITARRTGRFQIALRLWIEQAGWRADISPEDRGLLAEPAHMYIAEAAGKLHRKVLKRGRNFNRLSPEARHRVRLALKRLRDVAGFFPANLGRKKARRRYERRLVRLQEQLGRYNDVFVAGQLVRRISKGRISAAGRHAIEGLCAGQAASRRRSEEKLRSAWTKFSEIDCAIRVDGRK